jgi:diaminohydroxyphosphoribosylaminopyrimidine deaminase/5-amino-6-(5-phosphoribosylamino)uracil reductase
VVAGATDPNPRHRGKAFEILGEAGIKVTQGLLCEECERLNEAFNHWIVHHTPLVVVKAAMSLDGKIATTSGQSKWITGEEARQYGMHLRRGADAVLVGINTILADDPSLTIRDSSSQAKRYRPSSIQHLASSKVLRRIVLDACARTPLAAKIVTDQDAAATTVIVAESAAKTRVKSLGDRVRILVAPVLDSGSRVHSALGKVPSTRIWMKHPKSILRLDLRWILKTLGAENVTNLLVEGGGEVNASFVMQGLAQRITFFYAPKILGGRDARTAVAGEGASRLREAIEIIEPEWLKLGADWLLTGRVAGRKTAR